MSDQALDEALTSGGWMRNESKRELVMDFQEGVLRARCWMDSLEAVSRLPLGIWATSTAGMKGMEASLRCA